MVPLLRAFDLHWTGYLGMYVNFFIFSLETYSKNKYENNSLPRRLLLQYFFFTQQAYLILFVLETGKQLK